MVTPTDERKAYGRLCVEDYQILYEGRVFCDCFDSDLGGGKAAAETVAALFNEWLDKQEAIRKGLARRKAGRAILDRLDEWIDRVCDWQRNSPSRRAIAFCLHLGLIVLAGGLLFLGLAVVAAVCLAMLST